jgi:ABC-type lipoprotein export system ATPase subunit
MITHDQALAARCGRIVEMRDGLIVADSGEVMHSLQTDVG